jgi:hypothetical protein
MSLELHQPDGEGGIEPRPVHEKDYRTQLRSPRWGQGLRHGALPQHKNVEMNPTSRLRSVLFWVSLGIATFVLLVAGYGSGFWHRAEPTPAPTPVVSQAPTP